MQKSIFIKNVQEELKNQDISISQEVVKTILEVVEAKRDEAVLAGDEVTIMGTKFGSKLQKGREGTIQLGDRKGEPFKTEDKTVGYAKLTPSKKAELTR